MDYGECSAMISKMIRPSSFPLGVKVVGPNDALPDRATRPSKYGIQISLCQWTTMARRWGRTLGVLAEDINCSACSAALGLKKMEDKTNLAAYFMEMGYFDRWKTAQMAAREIDPLPPGNINGIIMFPLDQAPADPDMVWIYGTPAQMARLAAAYVYHAGELIQSKTTGFGISCLHPGRGERILAATDDSEMFFTFPANKLEVLTDGLDKTQKKGTRFPVQSYMLYQPPVLAAMQELENRLQ